MTFGVSVSKPAVFQRFTAVDLVTIAVLAVLYRAMWYLWNAFSFAFPFNQVLNAFFYCLCGVAALVIVRKVGAATLFIIAATLINVLIQGESLAIAVIGGFTAIFGDVYVWAILRAGRNPFASRRDMNVAGVLLSLGFNVALWVIMFKLVYKIPLDNGILIAVFVLATAGGIAGGVLGYLLGDKVKGLLG
jgi:ABC-type thiamin/hydroxymethylpyrimidine transport system permease subunit